MTITLGGLELEIARRAAVFEDHTILASPAPTTTTFALAGVISSMDLGDNYAGQWVLRPNAPDAEARARRVASVNRTTGVVTVDRAYGAVPAAEEPVVITPLHPIDHIHRAALSGLNRCFFVDRVTVPVTAGRVEEDLSAALPWITAVSQIRDVRSRIGDAGVARPTDLAWYEPFSSSSGVSVGVVAPVGGVYVVEALRPHATWVNGADSTTGPLVGTDTLEVALDYAAAAGHIELWRYARAVLAPVSSGPQALAPGRTEARDEFERMVRSQPWYWDRPDWVRVRDPGLGASAAEWVTGSSTWNSVSQTFTWRGLSALTWRQVLGL